MSLAIQKRFRSAWDRVNRDLSDLTNTKFAGYSKLRMALSLRGFKAHL
jgi:hypothetical protein